MQVLDGATGGFSSGSTAVPLFGPTELSRTTNTQSIP